MTSPVPPASLPWGAELPLVGRRHELATVRRHLADAIEGRGSCVLLTGDPGVGKSRLLAQLARDAAGRGMLVAAGSAFAIESGVPYGAVADALARPLRALDASTITVLARGTEGDLRAVIPGLAGTHASARESARDGDGTAHLPWNVTQFLTRLAARTPLLLVLDNMHECDASSLELLHFLARQLAGARILLVLAYPAQDADTPSPLQDVVRSLLARREATLVRMEPLSQAHLDELLQRALSLDAGEAREHAVALWSHTRGNPFFVDETLRALCAAGRIRRAGQAWQVDTVVPASLPATVRDAVLARLATLDPDARRLAEIAALAESRVSLALLGRVAALDDAPLADALDLLCRRQVFVEHRVDDGAEYEFAHPIIQGTVRSTLTAARERVLHAGIASALEALHGEAAIAHAGAMARHLVLGRDLRSNARTLSYLAAAGRDAMARRADLEAARWLGEALAIADELGDTHAVAGLLDDLAIAQVRLGRAGEAMQLWHRAMDLADARGDTAARATLLLSLAQVAARTGHGTKGLTLLDAAEQAATDAQRTELLVRIGVARAKMQQALGDHDAATRAVRDTLAVAEARGDATLLARVHGVALQLYAWTGPASTARAHGAAALDFAAQCGDRDAAWAAHWAMAMLEGFTGDAEGVARHARAASALADALASPSLQAMTAEIEIEHASGTGRWDEALAIAERTIPVARAIMPQSLLPRLLVWTGLIQLERDASESAHAAFEEAWQLSGASRVQAGGDVPIDNVHNVILAHTGMGAWALSHAEWARAVEYGERGLALADRHGYVAWAIHRLIPMMIEALLRLGEFERVSALTARLREQSAALGHRLGLAWAAAADALVGRLRDERPDTAARLLAAAEELEAVPFVFHGARLRRNAAQVLAMDGDEAGAARELRLAHDVFARLGAAFELRGVRDQLRALGVRLPPRTVAAGASTLTGRELEIARAVARRLTNKEIGTALDISSRTVSTHLSNIYAKLGVDSRGALADLVREYPLLGGA